jgi:hypothetical protein
MFSQCDLRHKRGVQESEATEFAKTHEIPFIETSALEASGIDEAFTIVLTGCTYDCSSFCGLFDQNDCAAEIYKIISKKQIGSQDGKVIGAPTLAGQKIAAPAAAPAPAPVGRTCC